MRRSMAAASGQFIRNLERFRLVTFDITETLLRFRRPPAIQYAKTASQLGIVDIDQPLLERCFQREFKTMTLEYPNFGRNSPNLSWEEWWVRLVKNIFFCVEPNIDAKKLNQLADTLVAIYRTRECWSHIDGGRELVQRVRDAGKQVGVISNFDPSLLEVLSEMGIANSFDFVVTSYEAGYQKPDKRIYQLTLQRSKAQAHEALHIGNAYELDYLGARNAGWSSLLVNRNDIEMQNAAVTHAYHSIKELLYALDTKDIHW